MPPTDIQAVSHAPSTTNPSNGKWQATNDNLWEQVLDVASGKRRQLVIGDRTINSPNEGKGFRDMPQNPMGIAWAVKQYNGFGGSWKGKEEGKTALSKMHSGTSVTVTTASEVDHATLMGLKAQGMVRLAGVTSQAPYRHYWEITPKGARTVTASLGEDLKRKMGDLLQNFDAVKAQSVGEWIEATFRVTSPQTPKGGKELKDRVQKLVWVLKFRASQSGSDVAQSEVSNDWKAIEPHLSQLVNLFTSEGGKVIPKEVTLSGVTYINEVGVDEATVEKYAKRLSTIFDSVRGWRAKAMKGGLKVVLASPRNFRGTVTGKYKTNEDALYVRATPNVLKRGAGYGSFEYVITHELGHRFERFNHLPQDFEKSNWMTTRYSRTEGEAFAELFALGHFKLNGAWDGTIVDRFENVMTGQV